MSAAQHFVYCFIGVKLPGRNVENANPDLSILEDGAEDRLGGDGDCR